ncbi:uncharacterized protein [Amphiura filiformis]|uniref:uncharacterized protein n=1 Tax=Amphiura filiformis TaxID=82378 RepID=UPI003B21888E
MYRLGISCVLQVLLILCVLTDQFSFIEAHKCEVGQENDDNHVWRWALLHPDPCQCTSVIYGGANTIRPMRRFKPVYVDHPLATSNISMTIKHYDLDCMNFTCPETRVETETDPGKATAMVQWLDPVPTDSTDYVYKATCYPISGTNFNIGNSSVVCKAFDRRGIKKTCRFDVRVEDNEAPSLAHCPDQAINTSLGSSTSMTAWEEPVATDNSDHTPTVTCNPPSGTINFSNGQKHVTCTAVDEYGNQESCSFYVVDDCLHQLGMEDSRIEDGQITASSMWSNKASHGPHNARLNHQKGTTTGGAFVAGAWVAAINDSNQWIQVNLRAVMWVSRVMIQGRNGHDQWVTKFKVLYKTYGVDWKYVQTLKNNGDMVFPGNTDQDTVVTRPFPSPVRATVIRIQPMEWRRRISMRFDLIGCEDPEWHLMFKAVSSIATADMDSTNGLDEFDPFQVWKGAESLNEEARQLNAKFDGHYKSSLAGDWEISNIDKVMVVLLDHTGMELVTLMFNGTGSNSLNWFSKERLLSSPYDDIQSESQNYFSTEGHPEVGRRWFISRAYNGCPDDTGWMVVACGFQFTNLHCDWEKYDVLPVFLYSLTNKNTKWSTVKDIKPLGLASRDVLDSQLTASSYFYDDTHTRSPEFGRLNNDQSWAPLTNDNEKYQWLQVDFLSAVGMKGIQTQGAGLVQQWVTTLSIKTGNDENSLAPIMESGIDKIFTANADANDVEYIEFPVTIFARLLRVIPITWNEWPAMRMEVMGYHTGTTRSITRGALRWSLPYKERCYCQGVVAPRNSPQTCTTYKDRSGDKTLWFVDDPTPLTNRMNWNKQALDILLEREEYCDHGDPVLASCPVNQATNTDPGQSTAMIAWQGPVATDNSGDRPTVNCDPPSGTNFVIRQTLVTCTASDGYGNNASCAFNVDVLVWDLMQSSQMTKSPPQSLGRQRLPSEYWSRENGMGYHQSRPQPD